MARTLFAAVVVCSRGPARSTGVCFNPPVTSWEDQSWDVWSSSERVVPEWWHPCGPTRCSHCSPLHCGEGWPFTRFEPQPLQVSPFHPQRFRSLSVYTPPTDPCHSPKVLTPALPNWSTRLLWGDLPIKAWESEMFSHRPKCPGWLPAGDFTPTSWLILPKVSYVCWVCPPSHIRHSAKEFNKAIRQTLETILGGPLSDWSWPKAIVSQAIMVVSTSRVPPYKLPAAFLASSSTLEALVEQILDRPSSPSIHSSQAVRDLAISSACPDWHCLKDIDIPSVHSPMPLTKPPFSIFSPLPPQLDPVPLPSPQD